MTLNTVQRLFLLGLCISQVSSMLSPYGAYKELPETFNWTTIKPSKHLEYHKCYDHYECARLELPLDWTNLSNPNLVTLAVARLPATVAPSNSTFGGTILINPGGPSGSGVALLRWAGHGIQEIVDSDDKHFEILSFDPRGVQNTIPSAACFADEQARYLLALQDWASGGVDTSDNSLNIKWAAAQGLGRLCSTTNLGTFDDGSNIHQYVSTAQVAHDMVAIIDEVEDHRAKGTAVAASNNQDPLQRQIPLLNYWGYSYGTYLGNTFASIFPERIGRMILDGVVDAPDYAATGWTSNLQDNMRNWNTFFDYCFEAGPKCALFNLGFASAAAMQTYVEEFMETMKENPLPILLAGGVYIYTYHDLTSAIRLAQYGPNQQWPLLAVGLTSLMLGDHEKAMLNLYPQLTSYLQSTNSSSSLPIHALRSSDPFGRRSLDLVDPFNNRTDPYPPGYPASYEVSTSILCGDGDDITWQNKSTYRSYVDRLVNDSPLVGAIWAQITLSCRHWPSSLRPAERNRFTGPFTSNLTDYDKRASPLLFIGNSGDPVTPVRNAFKMAALHEGARVLMQDTPGHCSGVNSPSQCTYNAIKEFFGSGKLPKPGTVCKGDFKPWDRL